MVTVSKQENGKELLKYDTFMVTVSKQENGKDLLKYGLNGNKVC